MLRQAEKKIDLRRYHTISAFLQMTKARSEDISKDGTSILNLLKKLLVSANTSVPF